MAVVKLKPSFKDYLWGGSKLKEEYYKETDLPIVAESWEISTHPDGESTIASGKYQGETFSNYIKIKGTKILGNKGEKYNDFPLLIKLIDAKKDLSIQVHPDDEYSYKHENQPGKTEMWVVLETEPHANILFGLNKDISQKEFKDRINNNTLLEVLNDVPVYPGDVFYIEAGIIHAIGAGTVLCEIQQNSNVTYRVYDYNRQDDQGNYRDLHIDQALKVSNLNKTVLNKDKREIINNNNYSIETLIKSDYFTTKKVKLNNEIMIKSNPDSFYGIVILQGSITLSNIKLTKGESAFIEANSKNIMVKGEAEFLLISL